MYSEKERYLWSIDFKFQFFTGFTTDGEFNSLRTIGRFRPISIIEVIKGARNSAGAMKFAVLKKYLQPSAEGVF